MIRCSAEEYLRWQRMAKKSGLTLSEWVRRCLNAACDPPREAATEPEAAA